MGLATVGKQYKVLFRLEQDEDGYPPNEWESLWATRDIRGFFIIDNIPFFVNGISCGDTVVAIERDGIYYFESIEKESGNSVLRVIVFEQKDVSDLRENLRGLGCESEQSHIPQLISIEVPESVSLDDVLAYLDEGESDGRWEYETASLRA
ncbi:MAG TPA: DUF4265 domain-containing protein [Pyrinomonadaceae bacterium]|nr:DUF4265 domain-containing protein [Pyrinomonadaceae bacterium]